MLFLRCDRATGTEDREDHEDTPVPLALMAVPHLPPAALRHYVASRLCKAWVSSGEENSSEMMCPSESLVLNYCFSMGIGMATPPPCNIEQNKADSSHAGFAGKRHNFRARGTPNVSVQTGYGSYQTSGAFPFFSKHVLLKSCCSHLRER